MISVECAVVNFTLNEGDLEYDKETELWLYSVYNTVD